MHNKWLIKVNEGFYVRLNHLVKDPMQSVIFQDRWDAVNAALIYYQYYPSCAIELIEINHKNTINRRWKLVRGKMIPILR